MQSFHRRLIYGNDDLQEKAARLFKQFFVQAVNRSGIMQAEESDTGEKDLTKFDGDKGIRKALVEVFGSKIVIQRCQWHKRENVLSYLTERDQVYFRKKLNRAYRSDSYNEAKEQLLNLRDELKVKNLSAARSLEEGLEETLTLQRLGLAELFGKSFSTTNCIENLNSQLGKYIGKVKRWKTSEQRYRWVASALLEVEQRMRKVDNFKELTE